MTGRNEKRARISPAVAVAAALVCSVTPDASAQTAAARIALPSPWLPGFAEAGAGEELEYHSPLPDAQRSLVVRSEDAARGIEWTTAPRARRFRG